MQDYEPDDLRRALENFRSRKGWSVNHWTKVAGLSEGTYRNFMKGGSEKTLTDKTLHKLASAAGVTVHAMLNPAEPEDNDNASKILSLTYNNPSNPMIVLSELNISAMSGDGSIMDEEEEVKANWVVPKNLVEPVTQSSSDRIKIITVVGNSMEPDFMAGQRVLVDTSHSKPSPPGVYVIWDGMAIILKHLEYIHDDEAPRVRLSSSNPQFPPREEPLASVHINGRVLGKWTWT